MKKHKKMKYQSNPEIKELGKKIRFQKCQEQKKSSDKVENFFDQVK